MASAKARECDHTMPPRSRGRPHPACRGKAGMVVSPEEEPRRCAGSLATTLARGLSAHRRCRITSEKNLSRIPPARGNRGSPEEGPPQWAVTLETGRDAARCCRVSMSGKQAGYMSAKKTWTLARGPSASAERESPSANGCSVDRLMGQPRLIANSGCDPQPLGKSALQPARVVTGS
ncbi:hypothetical protein PSTG_11665 [Puccinia striiformis f. sp. tritici PST-78]|uniref:Uncharacterized protein n=1 Tax=Puccinia striiformis f. sp. tritici PST-78 TaxID=1165861 RepID=A0A0L0V719_9BASI|nr:hypothetical protein PSTG_11665 [Puccinia striiformis f. sp. tritici PST-78]